MKPKTRHAHVRIGGVSLCTVDQQRPNDAGETRRGAKESREEEDTAETEAQQRTGVWGWGWRKAARSDSPHFILLVVP